MEADSIGNIRNFSSFIKTGFKSIISYGFIEFTQPLLGRMHDWLKWIF
jgi:hypothetical protein